ncbi:hypothetical protein [Tardiphaga sp.]|nr:hypothetical protein [Tardiphaga sp.]
MAKKVQKSKKSAVKKTAKRSVGSSGRTTDWLKPPPTRPKKKV